MAQQLPFSNSFSINDGAQTTKTYDLGFGRALKSLTIEVIDDNLGPIHVAAWAEVEGRKYSIPDLSGNEGIIFDGDGYNCNKFAWVGTMPLNRKMNNRLVIIASNYCGNNITEVRFSGVKEK